MNASVVGARHRDTVEEAGMATGSSTTTHRPAAVPGVAGIQIVAAPVPPATAQGGAP